MKVEHGKQAKGAIEWSKRVSFRNFVIPNMCHSDLHLLLQPKDNEIGCQRLPYLRVFIISRSANLSFTQLSKSRGRKNESGTWQSKQKELCTSERVSGSGFSGVKTRFPDVR